MTIETDEYLPTRRSLLSRLRHWDDADSWEEFFYRYWKLIYSSARRAGLSDADAQDVVQETVLAVAKQLPEFRYDPGKGSFKGWLLTISRRIIGKRFRALSREATLISGNGNSANPRGAEPTLQGWNEFNLETVWDEEWKRNLLDLALSRVKSKVQAQHFQIFSYAVLKEWPVRKIAQAFGLSSARIYLIRHRVSKLVKKELAVLEKEPNV